MEEEEEREELEIYSTSVQTAIETQELTLSTNSKQYLSIQYYHTILISYYACIFS